MSRERRANVGTKATDDLRVVGPDEHLVDTGLLYAINKIILHPFGYALSVTMDHKEDGTLDQSSARLELVKAKIAMQFDEEFENECFSKLVKSKLLDKVREQARIFALSNTGHLHDPTSSKLRSFLLVTRVIRNGVERISRQVLYAPSMEQARALLLEDAIAEISDAIELEFVHTAELYEIGEYCYLPLHEWREQRVTTMIKRLQAEKDAEEREVYERLKKKFGDT